MSETDKCCGWPEMGVCSDCPDPKTVAWGEANPPKWDHECKICSCKWMTLAGRVDNCPQCAMKDNPPHLLTTVPII